MFLRSQYIRASTRGTPSGICLSTALSHNLQVCSFAATLAPSNSKNKISSRTNQIALHLSSSSSSSSNTTPTFDANMASQYTTRKIGAPNTLEHRIYLEKDGVPISPFHDIPLYANEQQTILNMVVEIPRWTNAKMEVCFLVILSCLCSL
jgi:inorganic pyrophosphatase